MLFAAHTPRALACARPLPGVLFPQRTVTSAASFLQLLLRHHLVALKAFSGPSTEGSSTTSLTPHPLYFVQSADTRDTLVVDSPTVFPHRKLHEDRDSVYCVHRPLVKASLADSRCEIHVCRMTNCLQLSIVGRCSHTCYLLTDEGGVGGQASKTPILQSTSSPTTDDGRLRERWFLPSHSYKENLPDSFSVLLTVSQHSAPIPASRKR